MVAVSVPADLDGAGAPLPRPPRVHGRGRWVRRARVASGAAGLVVLALGLDLLVPRPNAVPLQVVDVASAARRATGELGFSPSVPSGLEGWTVTVATVRHSTDGIRTWHLGLLTPDGDYAGVDQADRDNPEWDNEMTSGGSPAGYLQIDGHRWERLPKVERDRVTLILREPGRVTAVSTQHGGMATVEELIRSLPGRTLAGG
jgi:hypothetical protein